MSDILGLLAERPVGKRVPAEALAPRSLLEAKQAHVLVPVGTAQEAWALLPKPMPGSGLCVCWFPGWPWWRGRESGEKIAPA